MEACYIIIRDVLEVFPAPAGKRTIFVLRLGRKILFYCRKNVTFINKFLYFN